MLFRIFIILFFSIVIPWESLGQKKPREYKIQIVLLLDVSGSMDGLISQAKGQFWRMVNELAKIQKNGQKPSIQISLGTFGNKESKENGYFKLYSQLTTDIDSISEHLFTLTTQGSEEYCGYALEVALDSLRWSKSKEDLRIIFIAGNEPFNQGTVDYVKVCKKAAKQKIIINTIYCGKKEEGIKNEWQMASGIANGKFTTIDKDSIIKYGETLWDKKIIDLNDKLNKTYVPFGLFGENNLKRQIKQDENVLLLGNSFLRERAIFKSTDKFMNESWDLVDAYIQDSSILKALTINDLPELMKPMTDSQRKEYLDLRNKKRQLYKESIRIYYDESLELIKGSSDKDSGSSTLDNIIINTIKEQAQKKGFEFK